jgi:lipocalin
MPSIAWWLRYGGHFLVSNFSADSVDHVVKTSAQLLFREICNTFDLERFDGTWLRFGRYESNFDLADKGCIGSVGIDDSYVVESIL